MPRFVLLILAAALTGCSGEGGSSGLQALKEAFNPPVPPPDTVPEMLDYSPDLQVSVADMAKLPEGVLWQDVVPGDSLSAPAAPGDSVEVGYDGWLPNGLKADSGSVAVRVGAGSLLLGLDLSLPGMLPGGRRKLVLTPGLAYGAEGADAIPPNAVLVYDVVLFRIVR